MYTSVFLMNKLFFLCTCCKKFVTSWSYLAPFFCLTCKYVTHLPFYDIFDIHIMLHTFIVICIQSVVTDSLKFIWIWEESISDSSATTVCSLSGGIYATVHCIKINCLDCCLLYGFAVIPPLNLIEILVIEWMHTVMYQIRDWLLISNCT